MKWSLLNVVRVCSQSSVVLLMAVLFVLMASGIASADPVGALLQVVSADIQRDFLYLAIILFIIAVGTAMTGGRGATGEIIGAVVCAVIGLAGTSTIQYARSLIP